MLSSLSPSPLSHTGLSEGPAAAGRPQARAAAGDGASGAGPVVVVAAAAAPPGGSFDRGLEAASASESPALVRAVAGGAGGGGGTDQRLAPRDRVRRLGSSALAAPLVPSGLSTCMTWLRQAWLPVDGTAVSTAVRARKCGH